jgi:hypothetical protein
MLGLMVDCGNLGGAGRQCVGVLQVRREGIRRKEQDDREQNTQCFHDFTLAVLEFYEIGSAPFLMSVFG